jgi:hypothetical protein
MASYNENPTLALIAEDPEGGYNVIDSRDGEALAWRGGLTSAHEVAEFLNGAFPPSALWPAHDTLVHEICMFRVGGEPVEPLDQALTNGHVCRSCPNVVPIGLGWDHLLEEAAS